MMSLIEFFTISGVAALTAAGASRGLSLLRHPRGDTSTRQGGSSHAEEAGRPSAGVWHEPRFGKRRRVGCRIEYAFGGSAFQGLLVDLSGRGWRARGTQPVTKGTEMTVRLFFPDLPQPILIDRAVVRWADGSEFGVESIHMNPESAGKLSEYLSAHYPVPEPGPVFGLSPFSYN